MQGTNATKEMGQMELVENTDRAEKERIKLDRFWLREKLVKDSR